MSPSNIHQGTFIGTRAGRRTQEGKMVAVGTRAGGERIGRGSTLLGHETALNNVGDHNILVGASAGNKLENQAGKNVLIGFEAGSDAEDNYNLLAIGYRAGQKGGGYATRGDLFIGFEAGLKAVMDSGLENLFIGKGAGKELTSGDSNTFLGYEAGNETEDGNAKYLHWIPCGL